MVWRGRTRNRRKAVAAVELAILLPFLLLLFVLAIDFARIFYFSLTVTNCARNGAIHGSQSVSAAGDGSAIKTAAERDAYNLDPKLLKVSSKSTSAQVEVTVAYPFRTITNYPGVGGTINLVRTVKMDISPLLPN